MRLWKVVVLLNLALALGWSAGYLRWGREVRRLREEAAAARQAAEQRQAEARAWTVRGIVRTLLPELGAVVLTHETIPGLMPGMTMGFEAEDARLLDGLAPGDPVRFTLARKGDRIVLVGITREGLDAPAPRASESRGTSGAPRRRPSRNVSASSPTA